MSSTEAVKTRNLGNSITLLVALRCLFFCFLIYLLDENIELGSSPLFLSIAAIGGILLASRLAFTQLNSFGFFTIGLGIFFIYKISFYLFSLIKFPGNGMFFFSTIIQNHVSLFLIVFAITAVGTWLFWKVSITLTLEVICLIAAAISLLSGHRNFHFESPKLLNNLAWDLGMQPLSVLLLIGAFILVMAVIYVYLASLTNRLHFSKRTATGIFSLGRQNPLLSLISFCLFGLILYFICNVLFKHYDKEAYSRTANGVGQEKDSGVSPLDFHSALGSTNQPSAMVRLEGDYTNNPFVPMLYLRESALSEFNGKEMVISGAMDSDVNGTSPDQVYKIEENTSLKERSPLTQSIYLLSEHKLAFAADYPIEIKLLKNPNTKRFKSAYRALSVVPQFPLDSIKNSELGESDWPDSTWKHYLATNPDKRYSDLAMKITDTYSSDSLPTTEKAFKITTYLNKNAIYTLTPNHEVKPGDDPVVPFLFGDMRGYCVHFAHATVYMLRSLGIPSRIATGYLTDLSQSRDGHILLRMSDRHAWAEVYVRGKGWIPFDTQPEKVESHAETQVDMKVLEELMGMLEPGEEILPDKTLEGEKNVFEENAVWLPKPIYVYVVLGVIFLHLVLVKFYLRYGWLLRTKPQSILNSSYLAVASLLYDLGFKRKNGETRSEFRSRILSALGDAQQAASFNLTDSLLKMNYSPAFISDTNFIKEQRKTDLSSLSSLPLKSRIYALFNPSSVIAFLTGHRW